MIHLNGITVQPPQPYCAEMAPEQNERASISPSQPLQSQQKKAIVTSHTDTATRLNINPPRSGTDLGESLTGLATVGLTSAFALTITVVTRGQSQPSTTALVTETFLGNSIVLSFLALAWTLRLRNEMELTMLRVAITTMLCGCAWWYGEQGRNLWAAYSMLLQLGIGWQAWVWKRGGVQ